NNVAAAPAILAALGAVGHQVLHIADPDTRRLKCRELANGLKAVNWMRGKPWEGIAGKFTPKGTFSLGGPKETAHAIFAASPIPRRKGTHGSAGCPALRPPSHSTGQRRRRART